MSEQAHIDCLAFAQDSGVLDGVVAVRDFTRLCDSLANDAGEFHYRIEAGLAKPGRAFMRLEAEGQLQLQCQRCMQVFVWNFTINSRVFIARHTGELEVWDREADGLEDAILADHQFDWLAWLEDEVLLALPAAPVHPAQACPQSGPQMLVERRPNPFAALAALKQHNLKP